VSARGFSKLTVETL